MVVHYSTVPSSIKKKKRRAKSRQLGKARAKGVHGAHRVDTRNRKFVVVAPQLHCCYAILYSIFLPSSPSKRRYGGGGGGGDGLERRTRPSVGFPPPAQQAKEGHISSSSSNSSLVTPYCCLTA